MSSKASFYSYAVRAEVESLQPGTPSVRYGAAIPVEGRANHFHILCSVQTMLSGIIPDAALRLVRVDLVEPTPLADEDDLLSTAELTLDGASPIYLHATVYTNAFILQAFIDHGKKLRRFCTPDPTLPPDCFTRMFHDLLRVYSDDEIRATLRARGQQPDA